MSDSIKALNRLAKWRSHFAGWQLGTRPKGDPECDAIRDHREATLLLRAEVSALTGLLLHKGICTPDELDVAGELEADLLCEALSKRWPGVTATDEGLSYDKRALEWMKGWKP
jgi:hypothetical protein